MDHPTHSAHPHAHGEDCGHLRVSHEGHVDYLHDGHLHRVHDDHVDECQVGTNRENPSSCTPSHDCKAHRDDHVHGDGCGHARVPHGDHVDFLADGHLHHPHGDHCDDHGDLTLA